MNMIIMYKAFNLRTEMVPKSTPLDTNQAYPKTVLQDVNTFTQDG